MNWLVLGPVVLGFLGVCTLLPRPSRLPAAGGALLGLAALAGLGALVGLGFPAPGGLSVEKILFYAFAGLALVFAGLTVTQNNPARSAICFAVVVLSTCGLFLTSAAPFLAAATVIVYAGAIIVTFLFVIMLSRPAGVSDENDRSREPVLASAVGFFLLGTLLVVLQRAYGESPVDRLIAQAESLNGAETKAEIQDILPGRNTADKFFEGWADAVNDGAFSRHAEQTSAGYRDAVGPLRTSLREAAENGQAAYPDDVPTMKESFAVLYREGRRLRDLHRRPELLTDLKRSPNGVAVSIGPETGEAADPLDGPARLPAANVAALGRVLFTDHLIAVELAGTVLLIATVGAIVIAGGRRRRAEGVSL